MRKSYYIGSRYLKDYFGIQSLEDNNVITLHEHHCEGNEYNIIEDRFTFNIEYSRDRLNWTPYTYQTEITLNTGDIVYLRGNNDQLIIYEYDGEADPRYNVKKLTFNSTKTCNLMGYISTLFTKTITTLSNKKIGAMLTQGSIFRLPTNNGDLYRLRIVDASELVINLDYSLCNELFAYIAVRYPPKLPSKNLSAGCYEYMFQYSGIGKLPKLPATILPSACYRGMFRHTGIKISETQTGEYQNEYRIPIIGTGTSAENSTINMFNDTQGTFTGTPDINTTYYTSNEVI